MAIKRLLLFALLLVWLSIALRAEANVELISFDAEVNDDNEVVLTWRTGTEENTAAFFLTRAASRDEVAQRTTLDDAIQVRLVSGQTDRRVPARGSVSLGARYEVVDSDVEVGETYFYMLLEIESSGSILAQDGDIIEVRVSQDDDQGGIGIGDNPTNTPTATSTATATTAATTQSEDGTATATATGTTPTATAEADDSQATPTSDVTQVATLLPTATPTDLPPPTPRPTNTPLPTRRPPTATPIPAQVDAIAEQPQSQNEGSGGLLVEPVAAQEDEAYPLASPAPTDVPAGYEVPADQDSGGIDGAQEIEIVVTPPNELGGDSIDVGESFDGSGNAIGDGGIVIGAGDDGLPPPVGGAQQVAEREGPNPLLWGVFLGGMLIFAAGVIGSIILFTRQRS